MDTIILLIKILSISASGAILADNIDFIQQLKEVIGLGKYRLIKHKNKYLDYILYFIHHLINCPCLAFYIGWIMIGFWEGFLCYFIATEIYKRMNKIF